MVALAQVPYLAASKIAIYGALQSFYTKFPFLASNDFVIAGESYGER